jgi:hypothetical protein
MTFTLDDRLGRDTFVLPAVGFLAPNVVFEARIARQFGNRHNAFPLSGLAKVGNHDVAAEMAREWFRQVTEAIMSDAFQDRENTFEKQFAHDEDLRFKAVARRNKAVALWVAQTKGLSGADAEKYASEFVGAQIGKSDDDVAAALRADLAGGEVDLSDHRLRKKMDEEMAAAIASVRAGT